MEQTLHLNLEIQYKLAAMEELSQRLLRVELPRYLYIDLLRYLLQLSDASIFDESIAWA